ncbi:MAG: hypothetical protein E6667_02490 [Acinetobacter junii]|nr:hypothetical protein [Acinetobacter junii]
MNAINFIQDNGVDKAREVVEGAPDKTATHYVFRKIPRYYSVEFQSWYHDGEWWDSDCHTEEDLINSYGSDFVLSLSDLKRLVESVDLVKSYGGIINAKHDVKYLDLDWDYDTQRVTRLKQAIADYESIYSIPESVRQAILNLEMHL